MNIRLPLLRVLFTFLFSTMVTIPVQAEDTPQQPIPPIQLDTESLQQLLKQWQGIAAPLGENSQDYIECLKQQPELNGNIEDLAALLEGISGMSQTCQFLLDDLLQRFQQASEPSVENSNRGI